MGADKNRGRKDLTGRKDIQNILAELKAKDIVAETEGDLMKNRPLR